MDRSSNLDNDSRRRHIQAYLELTRSHLEFVKSCSSYIERDYMVRSESNTLGMALPTACNSGTRSSTSLGPENTSGPALPLRALECLFSSYLTMLKARECGRVRPDSLRRQIRAQLGLPGNRPRPESGPHFPCPKCCIVWATQELLGRHLRAVHLDLKCPWPGCENVCDTEKDLDTELLKHNAIRIRAMQKDEESRLYQETARYRRCS
ncbi:hypothetical protein F4775DRAFT_566681 [Biscogniauxia sp. FL1348]|nr:hypothetical protein F4775DRAFT_566681 [Biscogniauxia sp. FL1348]